MIPSETNDRIEYFKNMIGKNFEGVPSGVSQWLDGTLKEVGYGKVAAEFVVREDMTNPMKTLHGGAAAMIMDDMMGMMVFLLGKPFAHTSVNLNCDFLSAASIGDVLTATAKTVRIGRNIIHCECEIRKPDNKLIAKSVSNLLITEIPLTS